MDKKLIEFIKYKEIINKFSIVIKDVQKYENLSKINLNILETIN